MALLETLATSAGSPEVSPGLQKDTLILPASVTDLVFYKFGLPASWPDGMQVCLYRNSPSFSRNKFEEKPEGTPRKYAYEPRTVEEIAEAVLTPRLKLGTRSMKYSTPPSPTSNWGRTFRASNNQPWWLEGRSVQESVLISDPISNHAAILEQIPDTPVGFGVKVFEAPNTLRMGYLRNEKLEEELFARFGVVPLTEDRVIFEGELTQKEIGGETVSVFKHTPLNFASNQMLSAEKSQEQILAAEKYFTTCHPLDNAATHFGMLIGQGKKPRR